jgi:glycerol uptake facilitator-like aquaporin
VILSWIAQVVGAFLAALLLYLVYLDAFYHALHGNNITTPGGIFYTAPGPL